MNSFRDREGDRRVLTLIGGGIIITILSIIGAISFGKGMPDWAESVFSAIAGGMVVKLADVLSALVQMSSSRHAERMSDQLASAAPPGPVQAEIVNADDRPVPVETR